MGYVAIEVRFHNYQQVTGQSPYYQFLEVKKWDTASANKLFLSLLPDWLEVFIAVAFLLLLCPSRPADALVVPVEQMVSPENFSDTLVTAVTGRWGICKVTAGAWASGEESDM